MATIDVCAGESPEGNLLPSAWYGGPAVIISPLNRSLCRLTPTLKGQDDE